MPTSKRVPTTVLERDRDLLFALKTLVDYAATNPDFSLAKLEELEAKLTRAEEAEARARARGGTRGPGTR